ncbi:MAG: glutamine--fructose-6-phosphate transaminase (isomerizing) [Eubacteriaceae bacterium]|jgi:glucosamine--fructose-6-phosphate aminotransferase (isomerizing)|nr:glutamine--fructose-6-phosphate transaminase (isomerizing) [Eubacteriaceae bacterium]
MCGIVGYVGNETGAKDIILGGLKSLEYRGYDSAGIALICKGKIEVRKKVGEISNLEKIVGDPSFDSNIGIGHTRWATHGVPSDINAHPHCNSDETLSIVHNGIIENYMEIKEQLVREHDITFKSDTDSEVIAHLLGVYFDECGDLQDAVARATKRIRGTYTIVAMSSREPDKIIGVRKDTPLVAGLGKGCNFLASDIPAFLKYSGQVYFIENGELVVVTKDDIRIFDTERNEIHRDVFHVTWDVDAAEKGGYEHFMLKEIHEQPAGIEETLTRRLDDDGLVNLDGINMTKEDISKFNKIYIVACGTAYHAGLVGKYAIEKMAKITVEVDVASEFRYRDPLVDEKTLFIAISQSGETQDTLQALRLARSKGARVLSVVNVIGSSVARESDDVFYTWAGPEIAVASTKAYTTQLVCMYLIALYMAKAKGTIEDAYYRMIINELKGIPEKLNMVFSQEKEIEKIAEQFHRQNEMFFIGRGVDSAVSLEGSLKLKEISYINSFAIAAGELKHGTIALVENGTVFFALATQDGLAEKMGSNIEEIKARGAYVIAVAKEGSRLIADLADNCIFIPKCADEVTPLLTVVPLQMFAYYVAKFRGCNIDKPKNLAKSVTVE